MGIKSENTFNFEASGEGTRNAYVNSSQMVASFRMEGTEEESED